MNSKQVHCGVLDTCPAGGDHFSSVGVLNSEGNINTLSALEVGLETDFGTRFYIEDFRKREVEVVLQMCDCKRLCLRAPSDIGDALSMTLICPTRLVPISPN